MHDRTTWRRIEKWQRDKDGQPFYGPAPRVGLTPCATCPKSHDGQPHPEKELSPRNQKAYFHALECRAVNQWPEDPLVRRNAAIILWVEQEFERSHAQLVPELLFKGLFKRR